MIIIKITKNRKVLLCDAKIDANNIQGQGQILQMSSTAKHRSTH